MRVVFTDAGWDDYLRWAHNDTAVLARLNALIVNARRRPHQGLGRPEPLKGSLAGWWSRRITREHRLVYAVEGAGLEQRIIVAQCRYHY